MAKKSLKAVKATPAKKSRLENLSRFVPLLILVLIGFFTIQTYIIKRANEKRILTFHYEGRQTDRGTAPGCLLGTWDSCADREGNFYCIDEQTVAFGNTRVQKFSPEGKLLIMFEPKSAKEGMTNCRHMAVNDDGEVFIREGSGAVCRLSKSLVFEERWKRGMEGTLALGIDEKDRLLTCDTASNSILYLDREGKDLGKVTLKKDTVASANHIYWAPGEKIVLLGGDEGKPVIRVVEKDGSLSAKFEIKEVPYVIVTFGGVDPQGRIYINDHVSTHGVVVYDLKGRYIGNAKTSDANIDFLAPGGFSVSNFSGDLYINTVLGILKMRYMENVK